MDQKEMALRKGRALNSVIDWERRAGKPELIKHLEGERLTHAEAMRAKCCECMAGYSSGEAKDCEMPACPLYPFQPYQQHVTRKKSRTGKKREE